MIGTLPHELAEQVDPSQDSWSDWGEMLRHHRGCMAGVLDLLPSADNLLDAIFRTRAIATWGKENGIQFCDAVIAQRAEHQDYLIGVRFGSSPYGAPQAVPEVGHYYIDPYLQLNPLTWAMVDSETTTLDGYKVDAERLVLATEHYPQDAVWRERLHDAEHAWFSTAPEAPVALVCWAQDRFTDPTRSSAIWWDATDNLLAMPTMQRRQVSGHRPHGRHNDHPVLALPERAATWEGSYDLTLRVYAAGPALIASRQARRIKDATQDATQSTPFEAGKRRL